MNLITMPLGNVVQQHAEQQPRMQQRQTIAAAMQVSPCYSSRFNQEKKR